MKLIGLAVLGAACLVGCAAPGSVDLRMASAPREMVVVDGLPVYVIVVPADDKGTLYDVEAGEGRAIAFTGLNEPLVYQARFRKAATQEMQRRYGDKSKVAIMAESAPAGAIKLFVRFSATPL